MNVQFLSILFGFGLLGLTFGVSSCYVNQSITWMPLGLIILGVLALLSSLFIKSKTSSSAWSISSFKKTGLIALVVLVLISLLIGANYLAYQLPWRLDVTRSKQHTLSTHTIELLKALKEDIQFSVLYMGLPPKYLENLLKQYEYLSNGRIKIQIIDPLQEIGAAAAFGNTINVQERKVIVQKDNQRRDIDFSKEFLSEEALSNAIERVSQPMHHVYFLTGHGEYPIADKGEQGFSLFTQLLSSNNIQSRELMLATISKIPDDCELLIIAGAQQHLTTQEEKTINEYLNQGGDALFLVENVIVTTPDKPLTEDELHKNPSLNNILHSWGIDVQDDIVVDLTSHAGSDVGSPATRNYGKHKAITDGLDYTFYVRPRSIR